VPTLIVTLDDVVVGLVPKEPVIPAGQFDAAKVTAALKPLAGVTAIVDVAVDPTVALAGVAPRVKFGTALTVNGMVALADQLPPDPVKASE
jgi:hypothetical protein